jgi:hypothetical protein
MPQTSTTPIILNSDQLAWAEAEMLPCIGIPIVVSGKKENSYGLRFENMAYREILDSAELAGARAQLSRMTRTLRTKADLDDRSRRQIEQNAITLKHAIKVHRDEIFAAYGVVMTPTGPEAMKHWHAAGHSNIPWH